MDIFFKQKSIDPFIVISFSDSSEKGVEKQAEWTDIAMKKAHQLYSFNSYNAVWAFKVED